MKTIFIKSLLAIVLMWVALPMIAQDWMEIHFKDGTYRKFYLKYITEIVPSKIDADGIQHKEYDYQRIITDDDIFVYTLSDVDSISFTKYDTEVAKNNYVNAMTGVFGVLPNCSNLKDIVKSIEKNNSDKGVEKAWCTDGDELFVKIKGFGVVPFHFSHGSYIPDKDFAVTELNPEPLFSLARARKTPNGRPLKAVIANQTHYDCTTTYSKENYITPLINNLDLSGIDVKYIARPTISFFYDNSTDPENPHLYDGDIILLDTHGCYDDSTGVHSIMTGEVLGVNTSENEPNESELNAILDKLEVLRQKYGLTENDIDFEWLQELDENNNLIWIAYPRLTEYFFKYRSKGEFTNPNSILFNYACMSLKGNELHSTYGSFEQVPSNYSFANTLLERKLGTYLGYNQSNSIGPLASYKTYTNMLNGYSLDVACYNLPNQAKAHERNVPVGGFDDENAKIAYLMRVPDITDPEYGKTFIVSTYTDPVEPDKANKEYTQNNTVTVNGITNHIDSKVRGLKYGFKYMCLEPGQNPPEYPSGDESEIEAELLDISNENSTHRSFTATIYDLEPDQSYYYLAYTYDGMNFNYGNICSFTINNSVENRYLMAMGKDNDTGTSYSVVKQIIDRKDVHENPDGTKYYRSLLTLEINNNGNKAIHTLDDNLYMEEGNDINAGQKVCMLLNFVTNQVYVFSASKDRQYQYTMEGYCYVASLSDFNFCRETVFTSANWGWYPYFVDSATKQPTVAHFSYAGYYEITSTRSGANNWSSEKGSYIRPDDFCNRSNEIGQVLIIRDGTNPGNEPTSYTTCPDGNHPHMIDLGLPSGVKWACCNIGASKPEQTGDYYAWGETTPNWYRDSGAYSMDVSGVTGGFKFIMTKYCTDSNLGTVDNKISLELADDVAHVKLGGNKRMPTIEEFNELISNCTSENTTLNNVKVRKFTGPNGSSIYLPTTGEWKYGELDEVNNVGVYWSRSLHTIFNQGAKNIFFNDYYEPEESWSERYKCKPVRAVMAPADNNQTGLVDFRLSDNSPLNIGIGENKTVNIQAGNGVYSYSTTIQGMATVQFNANSFVVTGLSAGTTTLIVTDKRSGQDIMLQLTIGSVHETPAEAIDLGLPSGTKWASHNIGANRPEEAGSYFAWGETTEKDAYNWDSYLYGRDQFDVDDIGKDIAGTSYDVAHEKWGGTWRLPTEKQCNELAIHCTAEWTTVNGVNCQKLTGPNGNHIILPASGARYDNELLGYGNFGAYWASEAYPIGMYAREYAGGLAFAIDSSGVGGSGDERCAGFTIRPVCK